MIADNILNIERYTAVFPEVCHFLVNNDVNSLSPGKHIISETLYLLVSEYQGKEPENSVLENHRKNVDIHVILSGEEKVKYNDCKHLTLEKSYDPEEDYELYKPSGKENSHVAETGNFIIFFPGEAHQPGLIAGELSVKIKKVVFKVRY